jgi:hypothetical protein
MSMLTDIITASDPHVRDQSLDTLARGATLAQLLAECDALETFRHDSDNLYERVRALFFLYAIHRFHLPDRADMPARGLIPFHGYEHLLHRRFEEAIGVFQRAQRDQGPNATVSSALAEAYHSQAFQTLADQVRRSVRTVRGNQWMFRMGHPADHPLRLRQELLPRELAQELATDEPTSHRAAAEPAPVLRECTPVRMDLSHSAWSDIFFLGMDFPEGARVLNVSIDLAVRGRDAAPRPPVEAYLRVIDEPVLRLTSVDLGATADLTELRDVFDFARDHLGLLKAALIASGIVPPGIEGCPSDVDGTGRATSPLHRLLAQVIGPGLGLELVSNVNDIPKGSRLAVSTNLLACLIACCMRATGQATSLTGPLTEDERRLVAARAILGEWLAGSGGGWQDSGGVWPAMKLIRGELAREGDPEYGISRGRLLPSHKILDENDTPNTVREALQNSLILVHGGMAQNVGPILEMVTEKYLLRSEAEWTGRKQAIGILDDILVALRGERGPNRAMQRFGELTSRNFNGPLQAIIPWASNAYTEALTQRVEKALGQDFWGFWMLGGMSGGGMGFIVDPKALNEAKDRIHGIMLSAKRELQYALPFAMDPVVYDFAINSRGTHSDMLTGSGDIGQDALMPPGYYAVHAPDLVKVESHVLTPLRRVDLKHFADAARHRPEFAGMTKTLFDRLLPRLADDGSVASGGRSLSELLDQLGFDRTQHEQIRSDLKAGRIGLSQNQLPANTQIENVRAEDIVDATSPGALSGHERTGLEALRKGMVAVMTLAAGAGSRWTQGAGVVKALHPFAKLGGRHRSFLEVHIAKSWRTARQYAVTVPHIVTTSYLTHAPIATAMTKLTRGSATDASYYESTSVPAYLSEGRSVGLRMIPMARDLRFQWDEMPQRLLDEQAQKVRNSLHAALIGWAQGAGEGHDYTDNLPMQCLHPVGHWFEVPNLLRNGTLLRLLEGFPNLQHIMLHNVDTLGASLDPGLLGLHIASGTCLTFEVITRRVEDRGGGLARVDGRVQLVEGLAMPREEADFSLTYYNTATCWVDVPQLLGAFGLSRADLDDEVRVSAAIRSASARMPTYITLKDVKKRWGHGQEDIFPVTQWEKLWGDMTAMADVRTQFVAVPRRRGQQLKDQAQLDGWLRDGSAAWVEALCEWQ